MIVKKLAKKSDSYQPMILVSDPTNKWGGKIPLDIRQLFFFDIETVAPAKSLDDLPELTRKLWVDNAVKWVSFRENEKEQAFQWLAERQRENAKIVEGSKAVSVEDLSIKDYPQSTEFYLEKAGLFPEYGQIIVMSFAFWSFKNNDWFKGSVAIDNINYFNESELIEELFHYYTVFEGQLEKNLQKPVYTCGHNIIKFDIPYVFRNAIKHNISIPRTFFSPNEKTWDLKCIDTIEIWRANSTNGDSSLETIMYVNGLDNPKDDITGKDLTKFYHSEEYDINRIVTYCEKDVDALISLVDKIQNKLVKRY